MPFGGNRDGSGTVGQCVGNNIITNDWDTDPNDCGSGDTGISPGGPPATIGPNRRLGLSLLDPWPGQPHPFYITRCDPMSGYTWALILYGPVVPCHPPPGKACITANPPSHYLDPTNAFISTPTWGDITG